MFGPSKFGLLALLALWATGANAACETAECCKAYEDQEANGCTSCFDDSGCTAYTVSLAGELQSLTCQLKSAEPPSIGTEVIAPSTGCPKDAEVRMCVFARYLPAL